MSRLGQQTSEVERRQREIARRNELRAIRWRERLNALPADERKRLLDAEDKRKSPVNEKKRIQGIRVHAALQPSVRAKLFEEQEEESLEEEQDDSPWQTPEVMAMLEETRLWQERVLREAEERMKLRKHRAEINV